MQGVGLSINPDQLAAQIEGNLIWGLGMALMAKVAIGSILGLEGYIIVNTLRHGRTKARYGYLPNRGRWVRATFAIGLMGALLWLWLL